MLDQKRIDRSTFTTQRKGPKRASGHEVLVFAVSHLVLVSRFESTRKSGTAVRLHAELLSHFPQYSQVVESGPDCGPEPTSDRAAEEYLI